MNTILRHRYTIAIVVCFVLAIVFGILAWKSEAGMYGHWFGAFLLFAFLGFGGVIFRFLWNNPPVPERASVGGRHNEGIHPQPRKRRSKGEKQ